MAVSPRPGSSGPHIAESDSDYGSDFDENAADHIFSQIDSQQAALPQTPRQNIEELLVQDEHTTPSGLEERLARISDDFAQGVRAIAKALVDAGGAIADLSPQKTPRPTARATRSGAGSLTAVKREDETPTFEPPEEPAQQKLDDARAPLERFRTLPKKAMTVTDFAGPAWCELQYWYGLTKGKAPRTSAMKEGSAVHETLESQVHINVPVETVSREDRFALRLWNVISSLRTLRRTGMTRELEVWGIVEGEVVNGKIDEITTACPDEKFEAQMDEEKTASKHNDSKISSSSLIPGQRTLTDFLISSSRGGAVLESSDTAWFGHLHERPRTIYLKDTKTRQYPSIPTAESGQLRPVQVQLTLYHHLFSSLSSNTVSAERVFDRYRVDASVPFTDTFIAQIAQMDTQGESSSKNARDYNYYVNRDGDDEPVFSSLSQRLEEHDSFDEILSHNNLSLLWELMMEEFALLAPEDAHTEGVTAPTISPVLTVDYVYARTGALIGKRSFAFEQEVFDRYVRDGMSWWKGERPPKGVELEEAPRKCSICHFAEECDWRKNKLELDLARVKGKRAVSFSPAAV